MIHFPPLLTARLNVQLRELTMREAVTLAATPLGKHEAAATALLALIVESAKGPNDRPGRWTVQERMFVVAHYIACTSESGNFPVGDGAFLDYLLAEKDAAPDAVDVGEACGDRWRLRQLTGDEAAAIESICTTRFDWLAADMAARLSVIGADEGRPDASARPAEFAAWVAERKDVMQQMPESDFEALLLAYRRGLDELTHLFNIELDAAGHVALPKTSEGRGRVLSPARFPASAAIGRTAKVLCE